MIGGGSPSKYPASTIEHQFCRSHAPKYASYFGDGFGRDSYIITNNGGLAGNEKMHMMKRPFRNTAHGNTLNSPKKESTAVNYKSDGTGRDSYVVHNSGGLVGDYKYMRPDVAFKANLRGNVRDTLPHYASTVHGPNTGNYCADITSYLNWPSGSARR